MRNLLPKLDSLNTDSRVCWWLIMAYVATAPFIPLTGIPISWQAVPLMDWQRLYEAAILFVCAIWIITFLPPIKTISAGMLAGWGSVFILGLVSGLQAQFVSFALLEWSWLLLFVIIATSMRHWGVANRSTLDRHILIFVMASSLAYLWWFWKTNASVYFEPQPEGLTQKVIFPGFANIRFFSDYQSFMLLLLPIALYRLTKPGLVQRAGALLVALYFSMALIVGSRSLIAAHLMLHALMLGILGKKYWPYLKVQLRFWVYGTIIFLFLTKLLPILISTGGNQVASTLSRTDSSGRTVIWDIALKMIQDNPLLGVGPLHFAAYPNSIASSPHNFPLQIAAEWGLPPAILLILLLAIHFISRLKSLKFNRNEHDIEMVPLAITCAGITVLLQALVSSSPLNYPVGQAAALLCFAYPLLASDLPPNRNVKNAHGILQTVGLLVMVLCIFSMTTLQSIQERNRCFLNNPWPTALYAPRFWQQGWLVGPCGEGNALLNAFIRHRN